MDHVPKVLAGVLNPSWVADSPSLLVCLEQFVYDFAAALAVKPGILHPKLCNNLFLVKKEKEGLPGSYAEMSERRVTATRLWPSTNPYYSYRNDSTGSTEAARRAGK